MPQNCGGLGANGITVTSYILRSLTWKAMGLRDIGSSFSSFQEKRTFFITKMAMKAMKAIEGIPIR